MTSQSHHEASAFNFPVYSILLADCPDSTGFCWCRIKISGFEEHDVFAWSNVFPLFGHYFEFMSSFDWLILMSL